MPMSNFGKDSGQTFAVFIKNLLRRKLNHRVKKGMKELHEH